jgi:molybdenum cofactor biosynthesis enzyme MoaA
LNNNIPLTDVDAPVQEPEDQLELASIHDFATKLVQPGAKEALEHYVRWQVAMRNATDADAIDLDPSKVPDFAPISINLDLTTACNYACDHCVDLDILNTGIRFDHEKLLESIKVMAERGMKSVIVIGGGEPTLYPKFEETIRFMKDLKLQIAIVSNGTGNDKIAKVADCMDKADWVRLSLDSGTDATFQPMHNPRKDFDLEGICAKVPLIKDANPDVTVGFSYIVTWRGAEINDSAIVENLHEIAQATKLAKDNRFDYISFKPFLTRDEVNNAEVIDIKANAGLEDIINRIQAQVEEANTLADDTFRVHQSTGLKGIIPAGPLQLSGLPQPGPWSPRR